MHFFVQQIAKFCFFIIFFYFYFFMEDPFKYFVWLCLLKRLMFDGLKSQFFIWKKKKRLHRVTEGCFLYMVPNNIVIYSTVLYNTVLYCIMQYSTVQYSIVVYSTTTTRCISRISSSDGVEEANYIRVIRKELMPWSNGLETEEQEVPDHVLVVMMQSIQAGYHVSHLQLLLGVLEEGDEGSLWSLGQLAGGYTHVKPILPQHSFPVGAGASQSCSREGDLSGLVLAILCCRIWSCILVSISALSIAVKVRGISVIPRASALWELPTCAGNIKPAEEARRPNNCWRWS